MKKISMALIALLLCITLAALAPAQVVAATKDSANQKYISEVRKYYNDIIVRTAKTEALAKSKITAEGHYILDQNLSAGAREVWLFRDRRKLYVLLFEQLRNAGFAS